MADLFRLDDGEAPLLRRADRFADPPADRFADPPADPLADLGPHCADLRPRPVRWVRIRQYRGTVPRRYFHYQGCHRFLPQLVPNQMLLCSPEL